MSGPTVRADRPSPKEWRTVCRGTGGVGRRPERIELLYHPRSRPLVELSRHANHALLILERDQAAPRSRSWPWEARVAKQSISRTTLTIFTLPGGRAVSNGSTDLSSNPGKGSVMEIIYPSACQLVKYALNTRRVPSL